METKGNPDLHKRFQQHREADSPLLPDASESRGDQRWGPGDGMVGPTSTRVVRSRTLRVEWWDPLAQTPSVSTGGTWKP